MSSVAFLGPQNAPKSLAAGAYIAPETPAGFKGPTSKGPTSKRREGKGAPK